MLNHPDFLPVKLKNVFPFPDCLLQRLGCHLHVHRQLRLGGEKLADFVSGRISQKPHFEKGKKQKKNLKNELNFQISKFKIQIQNPLSSGAEF